MVRTRAVCLEALQDTATFSVETEFISHLQRADREHPGGWLGSNEAPGECQDQNEFTCQRFGCCGSVKLQLLHHVPPLV